MTALDWLNALVFAPGATRAGTWSYGPDARQALDAYRPKRAGTGTPLVVFLYGGFWESGQRADYYFVAEALASRGCAVVVPDYRIHPAVAFPAFVEDAAAAVAWAHAHAPELGADPGRLYVMGHSAGGHLAAMVGLDARYLAAHGLGREAIAGVIALAGLLDFTAAELPFAEAKVRAMLGPDWAATQPIGFVDGGQPPLLLLHGEQDPLVGAKNSRNLAARVRERGGRVEERSYPRLNHELLVAAVAKPARWLGPVLADAVAFVRP